MRRRRRPRCPARGHARPTCSGWPTARSPTCCATAPRAIRTSSTARCAARAGLQELPRLPPGFNPRTAGARREMRSDPRWPAPTPRALVQAALERLRTGGYTYTLEPGVYGSTRRRILVRPQGGLLRAHRLGLRGADARHGHSRAHRHRLPGRRAQQRRRLLGGAPKRRPCLGRGLAVRPRAGCASTRPRWSHPGASASCSGWRRAARRLRRRVGRRQPDAGAAQLRAAWEAVNNGWNQWVLNYTQSRQLNLLKNSASSRRAGKTSPTCCSTWSSPQASRRRLDAVGAQPARPVAAPARPARARLAKAGLAVPETAPPRQMAPWHDARFGPAAQPDCATGC
jgi:hypothetical protein